MKIKHDQWGFGTVLYELSGGYQLLVNFDDHGKIQVLQKDCEKILDVEVEKVPDVEVERKQVGMCKGMCRIQSN